MKKCTNDAGISPDDIDLINANGNSVNCPDLIEAKAIKELFGEESENVPVHTVKSALGESYRSVRGTCRQRLHYFSP